MSNERGGILRNLLVCGLLAWGAWFVYTSWWPQNNPRHFGGRLENALNQELIQSGITDRDVASQVRKEHSQWGIVWVETTRSIDVASLSRAKDVSKALYRAAGRLGCSVKMTESESGMEIRVTRWGQRLQKVLLVVPHGRGRTTKGHPPQVAFVIDDVAYETASMDRFAALHIPLTFAILPREKHSKPLAQKAARLHFAVMLHLPMEPLDMLHNDPGPSGLYLKMTDQELKSQFDKNLASVPDIAGINNHMGSAFTANEPRMDLVMEWVKQRNLYFLDSRTTGNSVACKAARKAGVPCLANETFLDNQDDEKSIEAQLDRVISLALKRGRTIAIGHYRRKYLVQALADKLPEFESKGVQIVALPSFFHR